MRIEIGGLQRRLGTTTIYVTHDQVEAMTLGDRIVVLAGGRIQQVGKPIDLYRAPANRFVAGFIGTPPMNFVDGALEGIDGRVDFVSEGVRVALSPDRVLEAPSRSVTLGIRPEDLKIGVKANAVGGRDSWFTGKVVLVERLGGSSHIHLDAGTHRLLVAVSDERLPEIGDMIDVLVAAGRAHLFAEDGRVLSVGAL